MEWKCSVSVNKYTKKKINFYDSIGENILIFEVHFPLLSIFWHYVCVYFVDAVRFVLAGTQQNRTDW